MLAGRTCAGDSGGPLLLVTDGRPAGDILVGQVSFGFPRQKGRGCPVPNPATAFTDLASPKNQAWVQKVIDLLDENPGILSSDRAVADAAAQMPEIASGDDDGDDPEDASNEPQQFQQSASPEPLGAYLGPGFTDQQIKDLDAAMISLGRELMETVLG